MRPSTRASLIAAVLIATAAAAWNTETSWYDPAANTASAAARVGGGGLIATGGQRAGGLRCDHCHRMPFVGARVGATVTFSPMLGTISDGGAQYLPNTSYAVTVTMTNEHVLNPDGGPSTNGFAGSFETLSLQPAGTLTSDTFGAVACPSRSMVAALTAGTAGTTVVYNDCAAVLHRDVPGLTAWHFTWRSPDVDAGVVNFFYGVVDGVGNDRSRLADGGWNDDVKTGSLRLNP